MVQLAIPTKVMLIGTLILQTDGMRRSRTSFCCVLPKKWELGSEFIIGHNSGIKVKAIFGLF